MDIAKGIGILLVIIAHIYAFNPVIRDRLTVVWIYSFHMPLFFIIAGMLLKYKGTDESIKDFIIKKAKAFIIPYVFFSIVTIGVLKLVGEANIKQMLINTTLFIGVDVLWFLPALMFSEIIFYVTKKLIKNNIIFKILMLCIYIASIFIGLKLNESSRIFILIGRVGIATGFVTIGYYLLELINNINFKIWQIAIVFVIQAVLAKVNAFVDLNNLVLNNAILYTINSILGSWLIIEISKKINCNELAYLGKNSLIIMVTHLNLIYLFRKYINFNFFTYSGGLLLLVILLLIEIIIIYLVNKYFPFIIGKIPKKEKSN